MNWLQFLLWVAGLYLAYYLANILLDLTANKDLPAQQHELHFSGHTAPKTVEHIAEKKNVESSAMIASGGVSLREIFSLARSEQIIYTRAVSY